MSKKNSFFKSFTYAGNGIREAFQNEPNFRFHIASATIVLVLSVIFHLSITKTAILVITISLVIILELVNTAIEKIVDKVSPNYSNLAKIAKDVSAAAVLLSALSAILVGLLLFAPNILRFVSGVIH